jgi:hypothetical protein
MDSSGVDFHHQLVEVGALLNTCAFDGIADTGHGREGCIQHDAPDGLGRLITITTHRAWHVTTAFFNLDLHVKLAALRQIGNDMTGIDDFNVVWRLNVGGGHWTFAFLAQNQGDFVTVVQTEHHTFEVQHDMNHVFLHAINGGILVQNASDSDFRWSITNHGTEQNATQRVAQSVTVTTLEGLECHLGTVVTQGFNMDGFGFEQIGLHEVFLSIPSVRYTDKAEQVPSDG